jgi:hypothetical protein
METAELIYNQMSKLVEEDSNLLPNDVIAALRWHQVRGFSKLMEDCTNLYKVPVKEAVKAAIKKLDILESFDFIKPLIRKLGEIYE